MPMDLDAEEIVRRSMKIASRHLRLHQQSLTLESL